MSLHEARYLDEALAQRNQALAERDEIGACLRDLLAAFEAWEASRGVPLSSGPGVLHSSVRHGNAFFAQVGRAHAVLAKVKP